MSRKSLHLMIIVLLCAGLGGVVSAQGGPGGNTPSANGGSFGGPGMAGATGNGSAQISGGGGSFGGGQVGEAAGGLGSGGGLGGGRETGEGGGLAGGGGLGGGRETGEGGSGLGGGQLGGGEGFGGFGGFTTGERPSSLSGALNGLDASSLFGNADGSGGLFSQFNFAHQEGASWAAFGGFGASTANSEAPPTGAQTGPNAEQWNPSGQIPAAPSSLAGLDATIQSAAEAQQASANAFNDAGQAAQDAAAVAQQNAANAYDQLWTDYYTAVDYAADAYDNTMATSAEYAYDLYLQALDESAAAVDYYVDYAAEYAEYCFYYPWDCYSYVYDDVAEQYVYSGSSSEGQVGQVTIGEVTVPTTWPEVADAAAVAAGQVSMPPSSAQAYEALVVFANDQLGMVVQPLYAGDPTEEILILMRLLPPPASTYAAWLTELQAYWGIIGGGGAVVAVGDCSAAAPCTIPSVPAALSSASGGVYLLAVSAAMPTDTAGGLDLLTTIFPALDGLQFSQVTDAGLGMAFMATAYGVGVDDSGASVTVAKVVYIGLAQIEFQTVAYAVVAVGEAQIADFFAMFGG